LKHTSVEWLVEKIHCIALDREFRVFEESKIFDFGRILEVDEDADLLAGAWFERAAKKVGESKCRKRAAGGLLLDCHIGHAANSTSRTPVAIQKSSILRERWMGDFEAHEIFLKIIVASSKSFAIVILVLGGTFSPLSHS
jgi:hypothetical protein